MNTTNTAPQVRAFIVENYLFGQDEMLKDSDSFLQIGIIDSTGILQLVAFLEETYAITIEEEEIIPENLDSINNISDYLRRKLSDRIGTEMPSVQESVAGENA